MTPLVRRYVKTSFIFLAAGLLLGAWITPTWSWWGSCS